jgi:CRISPR-associated protein Cas1
MTTLYVTEQRALVRKDGDTLTVQIPADPGRKLEARKVSVPLMKVDQVVVFGEATITASAMGALLEQRTEVCYLSAFGKWRGRLSPEFSKNSLLRLAQHRSHHDALRRFELARGFVLGKLHNLRAVLMRANRKRADSELERAVAEIKRAYEQAEALPGTVPDVAEFGGLQEVEAPDEAVAFQSPPDPARPQSNSTEGVLMGLEGAGSAAYFRGLARVLAEGWTFERRARRPPTDPVNALLSFAYSLLMHQVNAAVNIVGFDPYIDFLHSSQYGKPALALDLMEEFRPVIADSVVLTVINNHMLTASDFVEEMGAYRLSDAARRSFLGKFEERLNTEVVHPVFGTRVTYRRCLEMQARLVAKVLLGEIPQYAPFAVR